MHCHILTRLLLTWKRLLLSALSISSPRALVISIKRPILFLAPSPPLPMHTRVSRGLNVRAPSPSAASRATSSQRQSLLTEVGASGLGSFCVAQISRQALYGHFKRTSSIFLGTTRDPHRSDFGQAVFRLIAIPDQTDLEVSK
jgi:hypothetical protein